MSANRTKLPDSIENPKLRALYQAAMDELDLIQAEAALIYAVNDSHGLPAEDVVPELAKDLNVHRLEYVNATLNEASDPDNPEKKLLTLRRDLIANAFRLHRKKGTLGALKEVLARTGRPDIVIVENPPVGGEPGAPYTFAVEIPTPAKKLETQIIMGLIAQYKRFVCQQITRWLLLRQEFRVAAGIRWDREIVFNKVLTEE